MADISLAIDAFLAEIANHTAGSDPLVLKRLEEACVMGEFALRQMFATDRNNHILDDPYIGLFSVFNLPREAYLARPRIWDDPDKEFIWRPNRGDIAHRFPNEYLLPIIPELRRVQGTPCVVDDLSTFRESWNVFTGGALSAIQNWDNIIVAGGSVLASLSSFPSCSSQKDLFATYQSYPYKNSDIDLFLWGLTEEEAKAKMEEIFNTINSSLFGWNAICFRAKNTITIQAEFPKRPIQIVMRLYKSPAEILCSFDIDCCCVAYDGTNVFTIPRGMTAMVKQCNTVDLSRRSPSYEHRLVKYHARGYEVFYPMLERSRINYGLLADPERDSFPKGLGRLVVCEIMERDYRYYPRLYEDSDKQARPTPVPMDSLRPSSYDYGWCKVPYGLKWWDPENVKNHVQDVCNKIIRAARNNIPGLDRHVHVITCGTMTECLEQCCEEMLSAGSGGPPNVVLPFALFRGPAIFITDDPGRQLIGSFNPINNEDWEAQAYMVDDDSEMNSDTTDSESNSDTTGSESPLVL